MCPSSVKTHIERTLSVYAFICRTEPTKLQPFAAFYFFFEWGWVLVGLGLQTSWVVLAHLELDSCLSLRDAVQRSVWAGICGRRERMRREADERRVSEIRMWACLVNHTLDWVWMVFIDIIEAFYLDFLAWMWMVFWCRGVWVKGERCDVSSVPPPLPWQLLCLLLLFFFSWIAWLRRENLPERQQWSGPLGALQKNPMCPTHSHFVLHRFIQKERECKCSDFLCSKTQNRVNCLFRACEIAVIFTSSCNYIQKWEKKFQA